jgi:Mn-dependent DtxR family transcriptional regulator
MKDNDEILRLLKHILAVQLYTNGATMDDIAKSLKVGKATVVEMLKGVKKE